MIFHFEDILFNYQAKIVNVWHTSHLKSILTLDNYNSNGIFYLGAFTIHARVLGLRNTVDLFSFDKKYFFTF